MGSADNWNRVSDVDHLLSSAASAAEVNLYSERQPFLMSPLLDAFTEATRCKLRL